MAAGYCQSWETKKMTIVRLVMKIYIQRLYRLNNVSCVVPGKVTMAPTHARPPTSMSFRALYILLSAIVLMS